MEEGWVKLYRKFLNWEWHTSPETVSLFFHLLAMANHEEKKWHGITIGRGQLVTTRDALIRMTGLSERKVRTCMERLKASSEVSSKTTNKYTIVTICNFDKYQSCEERNVQQNVQQNDQQTSRNKNIYNNTTGSSIVSSSSVDKSTPEESTISEPRPTRVSDAAKAEDVLTSRHCQNIADFWNKTVLETNSTLPQVRALSEERKKKIRVRWKEFSTVGDPVEVCRVVFRNVCTSFFCQGGGRSGWTASFDWVFSNGQNWVKAYEGEYDNKPAPHARQQAAPKTRLEQAEDNMKFIDDFFNGKQSNTTPDEQ